MSFAEKGDDVVRLHNADEHLIVIENRERTQVVFIEEFGDLILMRVHMAMNQRVFLDGRKKSIRRNQEETAKGDSAFQNAFVIGEIDVGNSLRITVEGVERANSVDDGAGFRQLYVAGGHSAGGGVFAKLEEVFDFLPLFGFHFLEDGVGPILRQFCEEVGGGTRIHLLDDVGNPAGVERFGEGLLEFGIDLFKGLRRGLFIERPEDGFAFCWGKFREDVGDVGWMKTGETLMLDLELYAPGGVDFDEVDEFPWDDARGETAGKKIELTSGHGALKEASKSTAEAHFHLRNVKSGVGTIRLMPGEVDVIHPNYFATVHINDLLIDDVLMEKEMVFESFESLQLGAFQQNESTIRRGADVPDIHEPSALFCL